MIKYKDMVSQWGDEKEKLEKQMDKLSKQLENIRGRTNRQSRSSKDKMNILVTDRQRATAGDYKLETIQEIHDEVGDIDLMSNIMSEDRGYSYRDISPRMSVMIEHSTQKEDKFTVSHMYMNSEHGAKKSSQDQRPLRISSTQNQSPKSALRATSEQDILERHRVDDTLNRTLSLS